MRRLKIALALVLLSILTIYPSLFAATTTIYTAPTGSRLTFVADHDVPDGGRYCDT